MVLTFWSDFGSSENQFQNLKAQLFFKSFNALVLKSHFWLTFRSDLVLEDVHVSPELRDGVSRQVQLKGQAADLVVDEPGNSLHLHDVGVGGANLQDSDVFPRPFYYKDNALRPKSSLAWG